MFKFGPLILLAILLLFLRQLHMLPFGGGAESFVADSDSPRGCERNSGSCSPCDGAFEGKCMDNGNDGWNNSISADLSGPGPVREPDGKWRRFRYPNYYGFGPSFPYSYGEPFYARAVKY